MRCLLVVVSSAVLLAAACSGDRPQVATAGPPSPVAVGEPSGEPEPDPAAGPGTVPESPTEPEPPPEPTDEPEPAPETGSAGAPEQAPEPTGEPEPASETESAEAPEQAPEPTGEPEPAPEPAPETESAGEPEPTGESEPAPETGSTEPPEQAPEPPGESEPAEEIQPEAEPDPAEEPADDYEPPDADPTPLPIDPAVRIGTLDNGLTYYIRNNARPGTKLSLRLAVDAGSLHEAEAGSGVAHFLEHMMFNGTEEYPGNEIISALRSLGVEFGPDVNAYTAYDTTVYELDVVTTQAGAVETAFGILSQWAHAATIAESDVVEERGIVRDELRLRYETGGGIIYRIFDDAYVAGTPYEGRHAIGTVESVESMSSGVLRDYYETWYVPSNMAVVAVGDLPVEELEELVAEHFGDIPAAGAPPAPDVFSPISPEATYLLATSPSQGYSYVSLDIKIPSTDAATVGGERTRLMENLIALMLDARLKDAYEQGFLSQLDPAKMEVFDYTDGIRFYGTNLRADDLATALGEFWAMMLSLETAGFSAADLRLAADIVMGDLEFALESVPTVQDAEYADLYVSHFVSGDYIGTVADRVDRIVGLLEGIGPTELTDYFRWVMRTGAPILIAVGADPSEVPTVEQMRSAIESAVAGAVPERTAEVSSLMDPPQPIEPISSSPVRVIEDAFQWSFANGATVVFVPSGISEAQVDLRAISQGGWSIMEPGDRALAGRLATRAVSQSGLAGLSLSQVQRLLEDHNVVIAPFIDETTEGFAGSAAADGIETMFQALHLFVVAPQVDDQAFADVVGLGEIVISLAESDADWQSWIAYIESRAGEAIEWFTPVPTQSALDALTPESLLDRYLKRLGDVDDLIVAVVGDIDRDIVATMARTYVGTLPAGEADSFVNLRGTEPPGVLRRDVVLPPDSRNTGLAIYFEAARPVDVALEVAADALATIVDARFTTRIREQLGATYSAWIGVEPYLTPEPGVLAQISASGDPEFIERIRTTILEILADIAENGPTRQEWAQALTILDAGYTHIGNAHYLDNVVRRAHAPDGEIPTTKRLYEELATIEAADVQALAAELFDADQHIDIVRVLG